MALGKAAVASRFGLAKVWMPLSAVTVVLCLRKLTKRLEPEKNLPEGFEM